MDLRRSVPVLMLLLALPLSGCNTVKGLEVIPGTGKQVLSEPGQTAQYRAMATYQMGSASPTTEDVTNSAHWSSANVAVGAIDSHGLATGVAAGNTSIVATLDGNTASSDLTVSPPSTTAIPATLAVVPAATLNPATTVGQITQFIAVGNAAGSADMQDLTNSVKWISSGISVATISKSGVAIGLSAGTTVITAELNGLTSSSSLTVTPASSASATPASLTVIPALDVAQITRVGETTQFLAIGNLTGSGNVVDLTNSVRWVSSDTSVATISPSGLATGVAAVSSQSVTAITAIGTSPNGSLITATSSITIVAEGGTVNLPFLSIYKTGNGTGTVTSSPGGINCGAQTGCTASYPVGTTVTLTATPASGSSFGGWSSTCLPNTPTSQGVPNNVCTVQVNTNVSVGAVFNMP